MRVEAVSHNKRNAKAYVSLPLPPLLKVRGYSKFVLISALKVSLFKVQCMPMW